MKSSRRVFVSSLGLLAIAGLVASIPIVSRAVQESPLLDSLKPDLVLFNGKIVTVDKDFGGAQALAIKDGKFVAVGTDGEVKALAGKKTQAMDLEGRAVVPGFIDTHVHFPHTVGRPDDPFADMFAEARSFEEIRKAIQEKVEHTPPGELVWSLRGVSKDKLAENRWPTRQELDPVSPHHPVLLGFPDNTAVVNSVFLKRAGITKDTPRWHYKGFAGEIVKDPETGEPNGMLRIEKGAGVIREVSRLAAGAFDIYPTELLEENIERGFDRVLKYGITSLYDPGSQVGKPMDNKAGMLAYQRLARRGELRVRINNMIMLPGLGAEPIPETLHFLDSLLYISFSNDWLRVGTVKLLMDLGVPTPSGTARAVIKGAHKTGWQMDVHVLEEGSFDTTLEAFEEAYLEFPRNDARHIITHAVDPTDRNIATLKKYDIIVEAQPAMFIYKGYPPNLTSRSKAYGPAPLRTFLDNGIVVMTGSDQKPIGPMLTIWTSVTRLRKDGTVHNPKERITLQEAIRAVTIIPAYASFEEKIKGSIEVGKLADLVVLGKDILTVPVTQIKDIPVMMTMVGGKWMYINPNRDPNQKVEYADYGSAGQ